MVFDFLCDFSSQRLSGGMSLAGFDYARLYELADRRKLDLDSYKWFVEVFENKMMTYEASQNSSKEK